MIGRMLGNRYELLELMGEGGMARVYKARCHLLNRYVAVKVLRPEFVTDEEFLRKFEKEAQASASLSHANIVNVYDVGTDQDAHYIVMELVNGITLKQHIQNKETFLTTQEVVQISRQVALALDHAHSNGIIHRDIKPHNILITDDGHVKVADFGIARAVTSSTIVKTNEAMGSVHYASPEQARGGFVDARSDLYSLGVLMFELATGRVPFDGDTPVSIALKHLKEDVVPPSMVNFKISQSLEGVILKLIQKEPAMRYQSAARLVEDLDLILANPEQDIDIFLKDLDSPTTKMPSLDDFDREPARKPRRSTAQERPERGKVVLTVIGAFVLALVIMIAVFFSGILNRMTPESVKVPDVLNLTQEEAVKKIQDAGLLADVVENLAVTDVEPGHVVSTDPEPGSEVRKGFTVTLSVSASGEMVQVPYVIDKLVKDAEIELVNARLKVNVVEVFSEKPAGTVIEQDPASGVKTRELDTVTLTVSKGPELAKVPMPDFVGKRIETVVAELETLKLKPVIEKKTVEGVTAGVVLSQSIAAGTEVDVDSSVTLTISQAAGSENGGGTPQLSQKTVFIPLNFDAAEELVQVYVEQNGGSRLVYEKKHQKSENTIKVVLSGSKGSAVMKVVYGDISWTEPVTFE